MQRVLIIGGHGKVALLTAPLLVEQGLSVVSAARSEDHRADIESTGAAFALADIEHMSSEEITALVTGFDVVIWSAGAGGGSPERTRAVDRDAAIRTIDASAAVGVHRFVMVSYFGASQDHGLDPDDDFHAYAQAKADADDHLRASDLDWTVLGPSRLTEDPARGAVDVRTDRTDATLEGSQVSRGTVAQVIAATVDDSDASRQTIEFNEGETPIGDRPWAAPARG